MKQLRNRLITQSDPDFEDWIKAQAVRLGITKMAVKRMLGKKFIQQGVILDLEHRLIPKK